MVGIEILQKDEPYFIPGYTGYCPQYPFECGKNYGNLTHELLLDPTIKHADNLVLVDNKKDHEAIKPTKDDIKIVNSRSNRTDPIYTHPMVSSYAGFVPNLGDVRDKPYSIQATQGISSFERDQLKRKISRERFEKIIELQSGSRIPKNIEERLLLQSKYKLPLIAVHPERVGLEKTHPIDEKYEKPKDYNTSQYFMDNANIQKYFINGYTGYRPYRHVHFGKPHKQMTADGLRDFTSTYLYKKKVEWAPVKITDKKKDNSAKRYEIYRKNTALMPSYTGHVPGAMYHIGKTYGHSSKGANHYIEEQLFALKLRKKIQ